MRFISFLQRQAPSEALDEFIRQFTPTIRIRQNWAGDSEPAMLIGAEHPSPKNVRRYQRCGDSHSNLAKCRHKPFFATREKGQLMLACFAKKVFVAQTSSFDEARRYMWWRPGGAFFQTSASDRWHHPPIFGTLKIAGAHLSSKQGKWEPRWIPSFQRIELNLKVTLD